MSPEREFPCRLIVQSDRSLFIHFYPISGKTRIRLEEGGYVKPGPFRYAAEKARHGEHVSSDPVDIGVYIAENGDVSMQVKITHADGKTVEKTIGPDAVDEIIMRLDQARAILHTYDSDAIESEDHDVPARSEDRDVAANA